VGQVPACHEGGGNQVFQKTITGNDDHVTSSCRDLLLER